MSGFCGQKLSDKKDELKQSLDSGGKEAYLDSLLRQNSSRKDSADIIDQFMRLAIKYQQMNDFENAIRLIRKTTDYNIAARRWFQAFYGFSLENNFLRRTFRLSEALQAIHKAFNIADEQDLRDKQSGEYYYGYIQSASTNISLFRYDDALKDLDQAYTYFITTGQYHQRTLINYLRGVIYFEKNDYPGSERCLLNVISESRQIRNPFLKADRLSAAYDCLAKNAMNEHQTSKAIRYYIEALRQKKLAPVLGDNLLCDLGQAYLSDRQYDNAKRAFHDALNYSEHNWNAYSGLAAVYESRHDMQSAETSHRKAVTLADQWSLYQQGSVMMTFYERFNAVYKEAVRFYVRLGKNAEAWETAEKIKARYLTYLSDLGHIRFNGADQSMYTDSLADVERKLTLLYRNSNEDSINTSHHYRVFFLESEKARFLDTLKYKAPDRYALKKPLTLDFNHFAEKISDQCQVLEWVLYKDSLIGMVIGNGQIRAKIIPVNYDELKKVILKNAEGQMRFDKELHDLYKQIFLPFEPWLEPGEETVIIPDDILYYLPFEMLVTHLNSDPAAMHPDYLLMKYPISYAVSASAFVRQLDITSVAEQNYLGLASSRFHHNNPLPGADVQVRYGAEVFDFSFHSEDQSLHKKRLIDDGGNYKIIDLATHVIVSDAEPMYSRIIFHDDDDGNRTGRDQDSNNGLCVYELFNHPITPDMLVLSGCRSGLGKLSAGEGFIGFNHALTYAGTASLLLSKWPVEDNSAAEVMRLFYGHLRDGLSRSKALQLAKIDYLRLAPDLKRTPRYWAAYTLWGNPKPIDFNEWPGDYYIMIYFLSMVMVMIVRKKFLS